MPLSLHEEHGQHIWYYLTNIIILIKQMHQQGDIVFQQLLKRVRTSNLTQKDINLLNSKIAKELPMSDDLSSVVVIQSNAKKHSINCYQIYKFAKEKFQNVYIFPASHTRSKTRNKNLVISKKLFQVQDGGVVTRPGLLYYTKGISIVVFSNICIPISLENGARYISIGIVLDDNGIFNLQLVDNQANNYSNLFLLRYKYDFMQLFSKSCIIILVYSFQTGFS